MGQQNHFEVHDQGHVLFRGLEGFGVAVAVAQDLYRGGSVGPGGFRGCFGLLDGGQNLNAGKAIEDGRKR